MSYWIIVATKKNERSYLHVNDHFYHEREEAKLFTSLENAEDAMAKVKKPEKISDLGWKYVIQPVEEDE